MWAPIFLQNKTNLVKALESYIKNLNDLKSKIENDNKNSILIDLNNINGSRKFWRN